VTGHTIFVVAGEPSGDMHGANLIRELLRIEPNLTIRGIGGDRMRSAGMELRHDLASEAIMGFAEVARNIGHIRAVFRDTVEFLKGTRPDLLVLIDYPGFNLRLAEAAKRLGIRTVYYICPQVWAWGKGRVKKITKLVEKALVILDFEEKIYREAGLDVEFVGHPLIDHIGTIMLDEPFAAERKSPASVALGLLPGSRPQEVGRHLPIMLRTAELLRRDVPNVRLLVAAPNDKISELAHALVQEWRAQGVRGKQTELPLEVLCGKTYEVISLSDLCLVASGTATLETAYFLKPMIVVYRTSFVSWLIARAIVKVRHIALVNILAGKGLVPEFIQFNARPDRIAAEALALLRDDRRRGDLEQSLREVKERLGTRGASERAARAILDILNQETSQAAVAG